MRVLTRIVNWLRKGVERGEILGLGVYNQLVFSEDHTENPENFAVHQT